MQASAPTQPAVPPMMPPAAQAQPKRWKALRILSTVFRVLAWIILGFGALSVIGTIILAVVIGAALTASNTPTTEGVGVLVGIYAVVYLVLEVVYTALGFLFFFGAAELILLFISLEENTRATAWNTQSMAMHLAHLAYAAIPGANMPSSPPAFGGSPFPPAPPAPQG